MRKAGRKKINSRKMDTFKVVLQFTYIQVV